METLIGNYQRIAEPYANVKQVERYYDIPFTVGSTTDSINVECSIRAVRVCHANDTNPKYEASIQSTAGTGSRKGWTQSTKQSNPVVLEVGDYIYYQIDLTNYSTTTDNGKTVGRGIKKYKLRTRLSPRLTYKQLYEATSLSSGDNGDSTINGKTYTAVTAYQPDRYNDSRLYQIDKEATGKDEWSLNAPTVRSLWNS